MRGTGLAPEKLPDTAEPDSNEPGGRSLVHKKTAFVHSIAPAPQPAPAVVAEALNLLLALPDWPVNDRPTPANVVWDSHVAPHPGQQRQLGQDSPYEIAGKYGGQN